MTVGKRIVTPEKWIGISTDTKPSPVRSGSTFYEYDTDLMYITYDEGTTWVAKSSADLAGKVRLVDSGGTEITEATGHSAQVKLIAGTALAGKVGIDQATANANEVVLKAGTAIVGKVGIDQTTPGTTNLVATSVVKTIQTELKALTAVAADAQSISSELDLSGQIKQVTILIDHAKDNAAASAGQGTEYVVQVSEKASGNDTWRPLASFVAAITIPTAMESDAEEAAGQTVIECGAVVPAIGDILFFENATLANSEWANVVARVTTGGSETVTLESGLTNIQAAGTYYTQGEHFVVTLNVKSITRLRVVANNQKGSTNRAIVYRVAAITSSE